MTQSRDMDDRTRAFYGSEAQVYANRAGRDPSDRLDLFLAGLEPGASILELGCGGGQDSAAMIARGFAVTPTDGVPEIAAQAEQRLGRPVAVLRFGDLEEVEAFDAVWANACLLHVPRAELGDVLARVRRALKPGGRFYASYKAGEAEGRDGLGRFYNYPDAAYLTGAYGTGWARLDIAEADGDGYDGRPTRWLHVTAERDA